jgi:hypothetical protein
MLNIKIELTFTLLDVCFGLDKLGSDIIIKLS